MGGTVPEPQPFGLDQLWGIWVRRKWLALAAFVMPLAVAVAAVPVLPNLYRASAVIVVERQQVPEEFVRSTVTSGLETRLQTMSQTILSRDRLSELVDRFDLYSDLRRAGSPIEMVIERMRRDLQVEQKGVETMARGGALVAFTVSYLGADPEKTAAVANTLAGYYLEENTKVR